MFKKHFNLSNRPFLRLFVPLLFYLFVCSLSFCVRLQIVTKCYNLCHYCLIVCLSAHMSVVGFYVCLSVLTSVCPSLCLFVRLYVCLSVFTSVCPSLRLFVRLCVCMSVFTSVCPSLRLFVRLYVCSFNVRSSLFI